MGLFSFGAAKQSYLGIDIGMSGVKIVELVNEKGKARLMTYAYTDVPAGTPSLLERPDQTATLIKKMLASAKCTSKKTVSALPISAVFSSIISVHIGLFAIL